LQEGRAGGKSRAIDFMLASTARFSSRVESYAKYRPGYPPALIGLLVRECGLSPASVVADLGFGTGLLTRLFLEHGCRVFGVEPNWEMRAAGERLLQEFASFVSIAATAEATTLSDQSVDFVAAGQAYHWFKLEAVRAEFRRILKPGGWVVLVWNDRQIDTTPFLRGYERLLETFASEYRVVDHKNCDPSQLEIAFQEVCLMNSQSFDYNGLEGRLMSSSYAPEPGHPGHGPMLAELRRLFEAHQVGGQVEFRYTTRVFYGRVGGKVERHGC
jgi:SAM-dependent methyltransferase